MSYRDDIWHDRLKDKKRHQITKNAANYPISPMSARVFGWHGSGFVDVNRGRNLDMENSISQEPSKRVNRTHSKKESEIAVAELLDSLKEKEILLQASESARREMEGRYEARVTELENRLQEREELLVCRDGELRAINFRADSLAEQLSQVGRDKDRMISEIARINAELKEKKLILAKQEREEWQAIGWRNRLRRRLGKLGRHFCKSADDQKSSESSEAQFPFTAP